jgi:hypothetical protein
VAKAQRQSDRQLVGRGAPKGDARRGKPAIAAKSKRAGKANSKPSRFRKVSRAVLLLLMMVAIGFFGMLVIDLGGDALSRMRIGTVTVAELWDKLSDRLLDRDVPLVNAKPTPRPSANPPARPAPMVPSTRVQPKNTSHGRAPLPAPSVKEYVEHVEVKADPETELARRRLDALMGRL